MEHRGFDLESRLETIAESALRRSRTPADRIAERGSFAAPPEGEIPVLPDEDSLVFASNNYLGLTMDAHVTRAVSQAADVVGTGSGASRFLTGDTILHHDLEHLLSDTLGTDRTLTHPSEQTVLTETFATLAPDTIFVDERAALSLGTERVVDPIGDRIRTDSADTGGRSPGAENRSGSDERSVGVEGSPTARIGRSSDAEMRSRIRFEERPRLIEYAHRDSADLAAKMEAHAETTTDESWLVLTQSVFETTGAMAPLADLCDVVDAFGAWIVVDESHAIGLYADGGGLVQAEGLSDRVHVQAGSLSTALASGGGYVSGSAALVDLLSAESDAFVRSPGLTPPAAAAASEALHRAAYGPARDHLWESVPRLRDGLQAIGYEVVGDAQICAIGFDDEIARRDIAVAVQRRGIISRSIPGGETEGGLIRLTPMATHTDEDILECLEAFEQAGEEVGYL